MSAPSYFGRAWKLTLEPQATGELWEVSNSDWAPEALRVTFLIEQVANAAYWFADISLYNCTDAMQQVIQQGDLVTFSAGYQKPGIGLLFHGRVFQPIWEREGDTDFRLTLHCIIGLFEDQNGYVSLSLGTAAAPLSQGASVRKVAAAAGIACSDNNLDASLDQKTLPRGAAFAGPASQYFASVAADNQLTYWMSSEGVNIRSLAPQGTVPDVVYAPPLGVTSTVSASSATKYTLVGTPEQTERGVEFRVLLDTDLSLGQLVKLDQAILRKLALSPGQRPILLDKDGLFVVAAIRYSGDSRGNAWYSEITGVTREWSQLQGAPAR